ncbi:MAG: PP2C family protein-serine/threonine phosphatase [Solirubrobacteraceae bacterium]
MPISAAQTGTLGVLLIEDDDDDALIVSDLLAEGVADVSLQRGRTLQEGLDLVTPGVDCVLLDLRLPDAVGLEGVQRVREAAPWIAVIVLTGLDDEHAGQTAVSVGAQDYLVKGKVSGGLLARAIRYAVGRRHAEDVQQQLRVAEVRADENARLERGLVPRPIVNDPSLWIASAYLPGRQRALLGGDFYDAVQTADGRLRVIMGDVSGRGPDEAALGAGLRIAWRALTLAGADPGRVVCTLELMIQNERRDAGAFATLCALEIEPCARILRLRRAGHPAPVLIDERTVTSLPLDGGGPPIGMFADSEWPESRFELPPRWTILLYTDGLIEGHANSSGQLGEDGLRRLLDEYLAAHPDWRAEPRALLDEVIARAEELNGQELDDDVAVLLLGSHATE